MPWDPSSARADFPVLEQTGPDGRPLVYLDSAATTLKPRSVIETVGHHYRHESANVHRGVHRLSQVATERYEAARQAIRAFLHAPAASEVVITGGTTDAINLVAQGFVRPRLAPGDEILITHLEHHANIVPWQMLREQTGCVLRVAPIDDRGQLDLEAFTALLGARTRFVSVAHVSNALGTVLPVRAIAALTRARGIPLLVDGAQAVATLPVDVADLGCDFYAFSGHKLFGPTGVGVLWGRRECLEQTAPVRGGGDMILSVTFEQTTYNRLPYRLEAGTPPIAQVIGLGAAVDYVTAGGREAIAAHDQALARLAAERLGALPGVRLIGTAERRTAVVSFVIEDVHPHDIGTILDTESVAIRAGHHCAQPVMARFGVAATARASFSLYNTPEDVDRLIAAVAKVREVFV